MAAKIPFMVMEARHYSGREAEAPSSVNSLGPGIEVVEERLNSFTSQLQSGCAILERIVYKNKNQHRRCSYFQYLLKVRRDLKLLQSANLEELLNSCFQVIHGKKPKQKVHRLESLKMRKCDGGKYNFMEQLLGAVRLLSESSTWFLLSQKEQSVKLIQAGIEVCREYYPTNEEFVALECVGNR